MREPAAATKGLLRNVIRRGMEQGSFTAAEPEVLETEVLDMAAWSLVHGLTMLLIDGLAIGGAAPNADWAAARVTQTLLDGLRV